MVTWSGRDRGFSETKGTSGERERGPWHANTWAYFSLTLCLQWWLPWYYVDIVHGSIPFFLGPRLYKVKRNPRCLMCQHVIVDFCLTFHSGQGLLISPLIINISVIVIFASSWSSSPSSSSSLSSRLKSSPPAFVQLWTAAKQQQWRCTLVRSEKDCLQKCRITIASDVLCGSLACFLNWEKSSGQLGSDLFFCKNQLPQNLHNDEWVVWSTRKLILWSLISSLGNLPKIALRNISHPGTERNMVGGVE